MSKDKEDIVTAQPAAVAQAAEAPSASQSVVITEAPGGVVVSEEESKPQEDTRYCLIQSNCPRYRPWTRGCSHSKAVRVKLGNVYHQDRESEGGRGKKRKGKRGKGKEKKV